MYWKQVGSTVVVLGTVSIGVLCAIASESPKPPTERVSKAHRSDVLQGLRDFTVSVALVTPILGPGRTMVDIGVDESTLKKRIEAHLRKAEVPFRGGAEEHEADSQLRVVAELYGGTMAGRLVNCFYVVDLSVKEKVTLARDNSHTVVGAITYSRLALGRVRDEDIEILAYQLESDVRSVVLQFCSSYAKGNPE